MQATTEQASRTAAVIGAGPAGLMAAEVLAAAGVGVTVYDQMPSVGRKFLRAGIGGLNLTHSEPLDDFLAHYGDAERIKAAVRAFPPAELRTWAEGLGEATFVGTSGRVFPRAMKASPLLRAWLRRLGDRGVAFRLRHRWQGWRGEELLFNSPEGEVTVRPDATVLALGGASWPKLGANGAWVDVLQRQGVAIAPLKPANCGFLVAWSERFVSRFEGQPLKGVALAFAGQVARGDAVVTASGLEGGAVYAISAGLRDAVMQHGAATLQVAQRPDSSRPDIEARLAKPRGKQSVSTWLRKALALSPVAIGLLQEAAIASGQNLATLQPAELAHLVDHLPLQVTGVAPIDRAISTAGGVSLDAIDDGFMFTDRPGTFVAGEMLDWEAPTGGYLLQACFATGVAAAKGALRWMDSSLRGA